MIARPMTSRPSGTPKISALDPPEPDPPDPPADGLKPWIGWPAADASFITASIAARAIPSDPEPTLMPATADAAFGPASKVPMPTGITTMSGCLPLKLISRPRKLAYWTGWLKRFGTPPRAVGLAMIAILIL